MLGDACSTGEEQWPAGSLSNEASQARPVGAVGVQQRRGDCRFTHWDVTYKRDRDRRRPIRSLRGYEISPNSLCGSLSRLCAGSYTEAHEMCASTCTCVGCTARCSCPSYIDKTITPPPQNWLLSQLFLSTGSSPIISFHPRLNTCIPVSFSRRARHSLVDDHTITLIEIAVLECESRIKSDNSLVSHKPQIAPSLPTYSSLLLSCNWQP